MELEETIEYLESLIRYEWKDREIQELEQFMMNLFGQRDEIVKLLSTPEVKARESEGLKPYFAEGMIIPFESKAQALQCMTDLGLEEGTDFEFLDTPGMALLVTEEGGGKEVVTSQTQFYLNYDYLPAIGPDAQTITPLNEKEWLFLDRYPIDPSQYPPPHQGFWPNHAHILRDSYAFRFGYFDADDVFHPANEFTNWNIIYSFQPPYPVDDFRYTATCYKVNVNKDIPPTKKLVCYSGNHDLTCDLTMKCPFSGMTDEEVSLVGGLPFVISAFKESESEMYGEYAGQPHEPLPLVINRVSCCMIKILHDVK